MTVTVLAILETDFKPEKALAKVMNDRLIRVAKDLQDILLNRYQAEDFPVMI